MSSLNAATLNLTLPIGGTPERGRRSRSAVANTVNVSSFLSLRQHLYPDLRQQPGHRRRAALPWARQPWRFDGLTPQLTATAYQVTVNGTPTPPTPYWYGGVSTVWNDASQAPTSNWRTDTTGATDASRSRGQLRPFTSPASTELRA